MSSREFSEGEHDAFEQELRDIGAGGAFQRIPPQRRPHSAQFPLPNHPKASHHMPTHYIVPLVGDYFRMKDPIAPVPASAILKALPINAPLVLEREFDNAYDPNAIKVLWDPTEAIGVTSELIDGAISPFGFTLDELLERGTALHVGYIGKDYAREMAPMFDGALTTLHPCALALLPTGKFAVKWSSEGLEDAA